jgi:hypothetical protein
MAKPISVRRPATAAASVRARVGKNPEIRLPRKGRPRAIVSIISSGTRPLAGIQRDVLMKNAVAIMVACAKFAQVHIVPHMGAFWKLRRDSRRQASR